MEPQIATIVYTNGWKIEYDHNNETERAFDQYGKEQPLPEWHTNDDDADMVEEDSGEWPIDKIEVIHSGSEEEEDRKALFQSTGLGNRSKLSEWTERKSKH